MIKEFHLFAGIGGGIYGGQLLGHQCVAGVEIDEFCKGVLRQRQADGWMHNFDIYGDLTKLKNTLRSLTASNQNLDLTWSAPKSLQESLQT